MIDRAKLTKDLQKLLKDLEADLRTRCKEDPASETALKDEWRQAKEAGRTAQSFEMWVGGELVQIGAAWILGGVFLRFLEDNALIEPPRVSGPGDRAARAASAQEAFFAKDGTANFRDYLLGQFQELSLLQPTAALFDPRHNPLFRLGPTADGARKLVAFFNQRDPATGDLLRDFTDPTWSTRFLGDLYQDLSEAARKRFALLQTPDFVLDFILDRTLEPAVDTFGLSAVKVIDPTCGSGHFVLAAFDRLYRKRRAAEPSRPRIEHVQETLAAVAGVDINPFAVAIARFRLLLAALQACEVKRLKDAPDLKARLATGDSLLHGARPFHEEGEAKGLLFEDDPLKYVYATEDAEDLRQILRPGAYHVVVGNPPYITPKDAAQNAAYRERYATCHMKYALSVPFMERFFDLAIHSFDPDARVGYVGKITSNSYMKREFGSKVIEQFLERRDLTHVIDTSGAYIPGHGTPTVILLARNRKRLATRPVRAVMGIRGEPSTPDDPARGLVWTAILDQVDRPGSTGTFVSVSDVDRATFAKHPWSIGGGGAAELKERLEEESDSQLHEQIESIGFASFTGTDEAFVANRSALLRVGITPNIVKTFVAGDAVRDWTIGCTEFALAPYDEQFAPLPIESAPDTERFLWPLRSSLQGVISFGGRTRKECGDSWWTWYRWVAEKYRTLLSIAFAEVATHNHFVLDRGGKVFKQTAPVIKLKPGATEDDHLALLGILNSSTACFWLRQVCHCKGGQGINEGGKSELWEQFLQFNGTKVERFPLPDGSVLQDTLRLDALALRHSEALPDAVCRTTIPTRSALNTARFVAADLRREMIGLQESLDWQVYKLYGLIDEDLSGDHPISLGERAFEIALARKVARGEEQSQWSARHGSTPITEVPASWPPAHWKLVESRLRAIETNPEIALIERPEYKRRWNDDSWEDMERRALRGWLLDRLETAAKPAAPEQPAEILSCNDLAERIGSDADFRAVAEALTNDPGFDLLALVKDLVLSDVVPNLPGARYTETGLQKRREWEETWELQRAEDRGEAVDPIPVPPKYASKDFQKSTYWSLRGKLDVPKERFVLVVGAERESDPTPHILWAGHDQRSQAKSLAALYQRRLAEASWPPARLAPILAAIDAQIPWIRQWHDTPDPATNRLASETYDAFVAKQCLSQALDRSALRDWAPAARTSSKKTKKPKAD